MKNINQILLLSGTVLTLSGCGGGGSTTATATTNTNPTTITDNNDTTEEIVVAEKVVNIPVTIISILENSFTIEWEVNEYNEILVEYGFTKKYDLEAPITKEGSITLTNLKKNTTYHYRIISEDEKGRKVVTRDYTFTTLDEVIPDSEPEPVPELIPPTSLAGTDRTIEVNNPITILGSGTDNDGTISSYKWTDKVSGQVLSSTASFSFTPTEVGTKTFVLTVTDNDGLTSSDEMILTVTEPEPDPTINDVKNIILSDLTDHSITVTWEGNPNATTWLKVNSTGNLGPRHDVTNGTYSYQVLSSDFEFTLYVQGENSDYIYEEVFRTLEPEPEPIPDPIVINPENPNCIIGDSVVLGKVLDINGNGVNNAEINIDGCITYSNEQGYYEIFDIQDKEKTFINITSVGFAKASVPIKIERHYEDTTVQSNNYITTVLSSYTANDTYTYSEDKVLGNKSYVEIPNSAYYYANGYAYEGMVNSKIRHNEVNSKEYRRNFPGEFMGYNDNGQIVPFESFGLISINLKDTEDTDLYVDRNIKLSFYNSTLTDTDIDLWKYDYFTKTWNQVGQATKEGDFYVANVEQVGTWSINKPFEEEMGLYVGRVIFGEGDEDGEPVKDLRVSLIGKNWIKTVLTTNNDGMFEIPVKAGEDFSIYAYTYRDDYLAEYLGDPLGPIGAGEVVDDRS